jgi:putative heme iron utilization protein
LVWTGLYRILVYSEFGLARFIQDSGLFRVWFRQVYSEFGTDRILVYSGFGLDRFIQDSGLFRVWFRQVYTGF